MKVAIIYGLAEGPWHGKRLRGALRRAGHTITTDPSEAEAIIAHSGGCYQLPDNLKASIILLVGLPYWPDKRISTSTNERFRLEPKSTWWLRKTGYNLYYSVTRPYHIVGIKRAYDRKKLPSTQATIILVRNRHDPYMHPSKRPIVARDWQNVDMSGHHDDLWANPTPYVKLLG